MATPVLCFTYPDSSFRFFLIYNTFTESPHTIPMDLPTFLKFHFDTNRTLAGFLSLYEDILRSGCSLSDSNFDSFMTVDEKAYLFDLVDSCDLISKAVVNTLLTSELNEAIIAGADDPILKAILTNSAYLNRHYSFFHSIHYTREWEMTVFQNGIGLEFADCPICGEAIQDVRMNLVSNGNAVIRSAAFYEHFLLEHRMPAEYMPHVFRAHDFYVNFCRSSNQDDLLLTLEGKDFSDELPF
jgi:hypothetical protein